MEYRVFGLKERFFLGLWQSMRAQELSILLDHERNAY